MLEMENFFHLFISNFTAINFVDQLMTDRSKKRASSFLFSCTQLFTFCTTQWQQTCKRQYNFLNNMLIFRMSLLNLDVIMTNRNEKHFKLSQRIARGFVTYTTFFCVSNKWQMTKTFLKFYAVWIQANVSW